MKENMHKIEEEIKATFLGEDCGKTSLINRAVGLPFNQDEKTTLSCTFVDKNVKIKNQLYTLHLWDTISREKFRSLVKIFLRDSKIIIFVYDITRLYTFEELQYWIKTT